MGVYYALEYHNWEAFHLNKAAADLHVSAVTTGTPSYARVETKIIVTDDLRNLDDVQEIMDAFVTHSDHISLDETVFEFTPTGLLNAATEMREAAETASVFDREEINRVVGIFEDALSTYMSEGAIYTLRFLG